MYFSTIHRSVKSFYALATMSAGIGLLTCGCNGHSSRNTSTWYKNASVEESSSNADRQDNVKTPSTRLMNELIADAVLDYGCRSLDIQRCKEYYSMAGLPCDSSDLDCATGWAPVPLVSEAQVRLFINLGLPAIPALLEHVDNCTLRCQCGDDVDLNSSWIPNPVSYAPVGKICCYLIDSILRKDPFFTRTGNWHYTPSSTGAYEYDECSQLHIAAQEYKRWFSRCYDEDSGTIVCTDDDLPDIPWDSEDSE